MAILRWKTDAYDPFERLQDELDHWLAGGRYPETSGLFDRTRYPALDIVETPEGCTVWADVPGLDKKDLELTVTANVLTLKGEKRAPAKKDKSGERIFRDETWTGSFQRSVSLPETVDTNKVSAEFHEGVLTVKFARKPEHKPRQIAVSAR